MPTIYVIRQTVKPSYFYAGITIILISIAQWHNVLKGYAKVEQKGNFLFAAHFL